MLCQNPTMESAAIHRLHLATFKLAGDYNPPSFTDTRADLFGYLVLTDAAPILLDTGIGEGVAVIEERFEPERFCLTEALARHGLTPADIGTVVNSHLHFDHCGNNRLFPQARILVQRQELAVARAQGVRYTVPDWFDFPGAQLEAVAGDVAIGKGVTLLSTPGHTPGHQSLLIETNDRRILIAAQAAFSRREFEHGGDPEIQAHEGLADVYQRSLTRLRALDADVVYFSHDS